MVDEERLSAIIDELRAASVELETADLETSLTPAERRGVTDLMGDATVVGLGETGHGVSELYGLRARTCRVLIEETGVRHLALEADATGTRAIDTYVTDGEGTAREALSTPGVHPFWQNQATVAFLEWARSFDEGRPAHDRIRFHGLDIITGGPTADALRSYLQMVDDSLLGEVDEAIETVAACGFTPEARPTQEDASAIADACEHVVTTLESALERNREAYIERAGTEALRRAARQIESVAALGEMASAVAAGENGRIQPIRDRMMAVNALRLLEEGPADHLVVLAHNIHVVRRATGAPYEEPTLMGERLHQELGEAYRAIGGGVGTGSTRVMVSETGGFDQRDIPEPPEDSLPRLFARLGDGIRLVDLGALPEEGTAARWLDGGPLRRPVPSRAENEISTVESNLRAEFDGYLFSSVAHPTEVFSGE